MLSQPVVRLAAPSIGVIAKHLYLNARNKHYALAGDPGRDLAMKTISAIEAGDLVSAIRLMRTPLASGLPC